MICLSKSAFAFLDCNEFCSEQNNPIDNKTAVYKILGWIKLSHTTASARRNARILMSACKTTLSNYCND